MHARTTAIAALLAALALGVTGCSIAPETDAGATASASPAQTAGGAGTGSHDGPGVATGKAGGQGDGRMPTTLPESFPASDVPSPSTTISYAPQIVQGAKDRVTRGLLSLQDAADLQIDPQRPDPFASHGPWSVVCNKRLSSDGKEITGAYQQWKQGGQVAAVETLTAYPGGLAGTAMQDAIGAANACQDYSTGGVKYQIKGPVQSTQTSLHYCQQGPATYSCVTAVQHGDLISQVAAFGLDLNSAQLATARMANAVDARIRAAGL